MEVMEKVMLGGFAVTLIGFETYHLLRELRPNWKAGLRFAAVSLGITVAALGLLVLFMLLSNHYTRGTVLTSMQLDSLKWRIFIFYSGTVLATCALLDKVERHFFPASEYILSPGETEWALAIGALAMAYALVTILWNAPYAHFLTV